jgi:DNA-binding NarL/FixJ family response regulator
LLQSNGAEEKLGVAVLEKGETMATNSNLNILIVEDEPFISTLVARVLEQFDMTVQSATSAADARALAAVEDFDAAILDIQLGVGPTGVDLAHALLAEDPDIGIVFLTNIEDPRLLGIEKGSIPKGTAYLHKEQLANPEHLADAVKHVISGKVPKSFRDDKVAAATRLPLSNAQLELLRLVALGRSNAQIAELRGTTVRAVERVLHRAYEAIGVDRESSDNARVQAVRAFVKLVGLPNE